MKRTRLTRSVPWLIPAVLAVGLGGWHHLRPPSARAATPGAPGLNLTVEVGPIPGVPNTIRTVSLDAAAGTKTTWYDVQDGVEHHVRGLRLKQLLALVRAPKAADTVVFSFADGMQIPVPLGDAVQVKATFIALEHGDPMGVFDQSYELRGREPVTCPKVVYGHETRKYSIWHYPTQLTGIKLVNWRAFESVLAQPTRRHPDRSGWPLYLRHCQPCHGLGGQGAKRGSDFLGNMDAYRRVPALAVTDRSQHPSLHEKVKGFTPGTMPVLNHISNEEVATLWRWLHAIHQGATR
jgi:hypothetical protein